MGGTLLVAHQDVVETFLFSSCIVEKRIIDGHDGTSGVAKDGLHTFRLQGSHQRLRSCNSISHNSLTIEHSPLTIDH